MNSSTYVKNPYIRSRFIEVLFEMSPNSTSNSPLHGNRFASLFESNPVASKFLVPALIQVYVDVETTGSNIFFLNWEHPGITQVCKF